MAEPWDVDSTEKCIPVALSFTGEEINEMTTMKADEFSIIEYTGNWQKGVE